MSNQIAHQLACLANTIKNTPLNLSASTITDLAALVQPKDQIVIGTATCVQLPDDSFTNALPWATSDGTTLTPRGYLNAGTLAPIAGAVLTDPCDCPCLTCP
jgi:hypothetical protein